MARVFITGFYPSGSSAAGVQGWVEDKTINVHQTIDIPNIVVDGTQSTSVRQQIQDKLVDAVNANLAANNIQMTIIASDIEYVC